jgi:hypothetical protein
MRSHREARRASAAVLCALLLGCRSTPPAQPPELFGLSSEHRPGSALGGAGVATDLPAPDSPVWIASLEAAWFPALEDGPGSALESLALHVLESGAPQPLRPRGELARGGRRLEGESTRSQLVPLAWSASRRAALLEGSTLVFGLAPRTDIVDPARPAWERLQLELSRGAAGGELVLSLCGRPAQSGAPAEQRILLDALPDAAPVRLFLPAPRASAPGGGLTLELALEAWPGPADGEATALVEDARAELARADELARAHSRPLSPAEGARLEREDALRALGEPALRRASLLFLSDAAGAPLSGEIALLSDEAHLEAFCAAIDAQWSAQDGGESARTVFGWSLERAALAWLCEIAADEARGLPAELFAALLRRTGELARYPDLLGECAAACGDLEQFQARVRFENLCFLEDGDPAPRLRAFDWLAAQDAAPPGYDPLGDRAARRAALAAARSDAEGGAEARDE